MNDFVKIGAHTTGKRFAISDIHGCYKTLRRLVEVVLQVGKSDQLFLLGDYVDRGPSSKAVLDYIMDLQEKGYAIYPLRGNHENDLLDFSKGELRFLLWQLSRHKYPDIVQDGKLMDKYYTFFNSLPFYYELEDYYLVHAGFDFKSDKPFENKTAMLWLRYFDPPEGMLNGKRVIHGHDPVYLDEIKAHIEKGLPTIPLDNGAVYVGKNKIYDASRLGKLCAFDLDTERLYTQPNIDIQ